jgi:hypothetical protein
MTLSVRPMDVLHPRSEESENDWRDQRLREDKPRGLTVLYPCLSDKPECPSAKEAGMSSGFTPFGSAYNP